MGTRKLKVLLSVLIISLLLVIGYFKFFGKSSSMNTPVTFALSQGVMNRYKFDEIGLQNGDTIGDIFLFDGQKKSKINLRKAISYNTKPTVLITGSYTCDVTRLHMSAIDSLYQIYQQDYDFYLVHTIEAHPLSSQSPYNPDPVPWEAERNILAGIAADQPNTIGEREELSEQWIGEESIQIPVLIDNAQNDFWKQTGQGPNMAIVLSSTGVVLHKEGWLDPIELGSYLAP